MNCEFTGPLSVACIYFNSIDDELLKKTAQVFFKFSPQICLRPNEAIFVEIGKCQKIYSLNSFKTSAQNLLKSLTLYGEIYFGQDLFMSLVRAKEQKPNLELHEVGIHRIGELLDPLKQNEKFINKEAQKLILIFNQLGIYNLGALKKIPQQELTARFGPLGRLCFYQLHFFSRSFVWPYLKEQKTIKADYFFDEFMSYQTQEALLTAFMELLIRICQQLNKQGLAAQELKLIIKCQNRSHNRTPFELRQVPFCFFQPQHKADKIFKLLEDVFLAEFKNKPLFTPIEYLKLYVTKSAPQEESQLDLLSCNNEQEFFLKEQKQEATNEWIKIVGKENVYQAELTQDFRPERAWQKTLYSHPVLATQANAGLNLDILQSIPKRCHYLLKKPLKVSVTAGFIYIKKNRYSIDHWSPFIEKITEPWFAEQKKLQPYYNEERIYHQVKIETNKTLLLFENNKREFFLHGFNA